MSFRPRGLAAFAAGVGAAALLAACSDGPASVASRLAPDATPNAGYALPRGCSTDAAGLPTSCDGLPGDGIAAREQLEVCKYYPQGTGPAVQVTVDARQSAANRARVPTSPTHLTFAVQPNSCVVVWQNGETYGPDADTLDVTEVVPAGYVATSQVSTVIRTTTTMSDPDPTHYQTTVGPVTSATTVKNLIIGGPFVPGALVVFRNTPVPPATFSIGDRVWNDVDGDGAQDVGEPGLNGLTVTVTNASSAVVGTATTAGDGGYTVANLPAGAYTVCVSGAPTGFAPSYDLDGTGTPNCASVTLSASRTDVDFGYTPPRYSIGDRVWNDGNANGVQDAGEGGLTGLTVTVTDAADAVVATTTTGANGAYTVPNLLAGSYKVCVSGVAAGFTQSYDLDGTGTPNCTSVAVSGNRTDVDFGYYRLGSIGDFVWNDLDRDGVQDTGEPGLAGVTVTLTRGAVVQTTTTSANGQYAFANLAAGTYTITVSGTPIGFVASPANVGANDALDSDGSGVTVVVAGASDTSVDFGFYEQTGAVACTYTQGYWKNHEESWPAPYSPTAPWMTPQRQVTGMSWDDLFGQAPKGGNSYVSLAHQWMAAKLNRANGAPTSAGVLQALNAAEAWLLANTPANGPLPSIKNASADAWASTLDGFNNGLAGTPHCN